MAKLYCPKCGPIRTTITRTSAGLDLDSLPPGPVPGSKCGVCGKQLHVGPPNYRSSTMFGSICTDDWEQNTAEMQRLQALYSAAQRLLEEGFAEAAEGLDAAQEAASLTRRFGLLRKKRAASEYTEVTEHLLTHYAAEVAYFVAVQINEQLEPRLGYPPIGQIMVAIENHGGKAAARWIACALRNFPRVETAQVAFGVIKSPTMRCLVRAELATDDAQLAKYIASGEAVSPPASPASPVTSNTARTKAEHQTHLSNGIERMPRRLADAERRGDRLFLHLQVVSFVLLLLCPVLGGVLGGWPGAASGLVVGWLVRVWMRHSMGIRGSNPNDGFFIRMKERATGSRRGILEALIERVRQRSFTQAQCSAITNAWDDTRKRIGAAISVEERRELLNALDVEIKHISYGAGCRRMSEEEDGAS